MCPLYEFIVYKIYFFLFDHLLENLFFMRDTQLKNAAGNGKKVEDTT